MVEGAQPMALKKREKAIKVNDFRRAINVTAHGKPFFDTKTTPAEVAFEIFGEIFVVYKCEYGLYTVASYRSGSAITLSKCSRNKAISESLKMVKSLGANQVKNIIDAMLRRMGEK